MRMALIADGIVRNIIIAESGFDPGDGATMEPCGPDVAAGWSWTGAEFVPPAVAQGVGRSVVSARQFKVALYRAGLIAAADAYVAQAGEEVRLWWEYETDIASDHPMIAAAAAALQITPELQAQIFALAADL